MLVISVLIGGYFFARSHTGPDLGPYDAGQLPAPAAGSAECRALLTALPDALSSHQRRQVAGNPEGVAVWGDPAIVLRCGLSTPAELTCSSALTQISGANAAAGVLWLQLSERGASTYLAADRPVRVAVTLPDDSGTGPVQELSAVIAGVLESTASPDGTLCRNGVLPPVNDQ